MISLYVISAIIGISIIILVAIITHLCYAYRKKQNNASASAKRKNAQFFLLLSIVAVLIYELELISLLIVYIEIILIELHLIYSDHRPHYEHHIYYSSFCYMEFVRTILNAVGHLSVILVFIVRFHYTFHDGLFMNNKQPVTALYICASFLCIGAIILVILMALQQPAQHIIIVELSWEILVHLMWFWVLYIFISKLYDLLQFALQVHNTSGNKSDLLKCLIEATKLSRSTSKNSKYTPKNTNKSPNCGVISTYAGTMTNVMTIDGITIDPHSINRSPVINSRKSSPEPSPAPSAHTDGEQTDNEQRDDHINLKESTAMELIGVMTKMTILVTFTVLLLMICAVSHAVIEMNDVASEHEMRAEALWHEIFHIIDALIASVMLYLQFTFTHKLYRRIFGRFDAWFLKHSLQFIEYLWNRKLKNDTKSASFLDETQSTKPSDLTVH